MPYTVRISVHGDEAIAARFADRPARRAKLTAAMDADLALIQSTVVPISPAFTGHLRSSWTSVNFLPASFRGLMGSPLIQAEIMEEGRRPGAPMPPPAALEAWVAAKMGSDVSAYVVARSIGLKGIEPRHMLRKTLELLEVPRRAIWDAAVAGLMEGT